MIFVTVGMHDQDFNRLVQAADELVEMLGEDVTIQRGYSDYLPTHAKYFDWASSQEMEEWIDRSRVVISHAGAGSIITVLLHKKPLVIVPRLAAYKEHLNDHQLQLASVMEKEKRAVVVKELSATNLINAIDEASKQALLPISSAKFIEEIRQALEKWQKSSRKPGGKN